MMQRKLSKSNTLVVMATLLLLQAFCLAQDDYTIAGRVTNVLTGNPVSDVSVIVSNSGVSTASAITEITGYFEITDLPSAGPYQIDFSRREYRSAYITSIAASVTDINIALEPREILMPRAPIANAGPKRIYIDWPASPETYIKGYNLYRTETDASGISIGEMIKLNGSSETLLGDLLESAEYIDENTEPGSYYIYRVQVVSTVDRLSELSEPSEPVRANYLTLFIPTVYQPQINGIAYAHPVSGNLLVQIPVAVECIYDVVAQGMRLAVDLPADAFRYDLENEILVFPTGLTRRTGITYRSELVDNVIRVFVQADGSIPLYGSGTLFHIFAVPTVTEAGACVPIKLNTSSTSVPVLVGEEYVPVDLEIFDGLYCNEVGCIYGDITNNGRVDVADAGALLAYLVGKRDIPPGHPCFPDVADINFDGRVDAADVRLILRAITLLLEIGDKALPLIYYDDFIDSAILKDTDSALVSLAMQRGETVTVAVLLENVPDLSGFYLSLGYPADYLQFLSASSGNGLTPKFTTEFQNHVCGEGLENGSVKISSTGQEPVDATMATEIALVTFSLLNSEWDSEALPVRIADFSYNDKEGYTPRHTDPAAPKGYGQSLGQAAALFCTLMDADTLQPITNATLSIQPPAHSPVSNNTNGVYAMPALDGGAYTVTAVSPTHTDSVQNLYIGKGETVSRELYLVSIPVSEGEGEEVEGEGETLEGEGENNEGEGETTEGEGETTEGEGEGEPKKKRILFCGAANDANTDWCGDVLLLLSLLLVLSAEKLKIICRNIYEKRN